MSRHTLHQIVIELEFWVEAFYDISDQQSHPYGLIYLANVASRLHIISRHYRFVLNSLQNISRLNAIKI